jgi:SOS response regulatory protein OraA/RecX
MTNTSGSGVTNNGERLARVTYLPGVVPPVPTPEPSVVEPSVVEPSVVEPRVVEPRVVEPRVVEPRVESAAEPESDGERSARAHNVSMHALTRKGLSSAEMTVLLKSRELNEHDVEFEVARLEEVGLLDDHDLASNLVRTLRDRKGLGRSAINAELRRRKIDSVAIEEAMSDAYPVDGDDELTRAREIAVKRAPQLRSLDAETARRRLGAFLMRKGYSGSVVASAVATALAGNAPTPRGPRFQ